MSTKPVCRCPWLDQTKPDYVAYHDLEWGVPVYDDRKLFEYLTLESAQAGLSWYTILKRREGYRLAFANFDYEQVARFTDADVDRLVEDPSIIRHRKKIEATINNAQCFIKVREEFGSFSAYMWAFVGGKTIVNRSSKIEDYPATTPESDAFSKDLKNEDLNLLVQQYVTLICKLAVWLMITA